METSVWALAPEWKNSRTFTLAWYDWIVKIWFVAAVLAWFRRLFRTSVVEGLSSVPLSLREWTASKPSSWNISFGCDGKRLVVLMAGHENGAGVDALCVRSVRDEFAGTKVTPIPGAASPFARFAQMAWDQAGKHVAVALFNMVHVYRIKRSGAAILRGSFTAFPECGIAGVALVASPLSHSLFALLFDGRLIRLVLPAGVNSGVYDCKDAASTLVGSDEFRPACMAFHHERKLFVFGGMLKGGSEGALSVFSATSLTASDRVAKHEWSSWKETSHQMGTLSAGCVTSVQLSPNGVQCLCVCGMSSSAFLLQCDLKGPSLSLFSLPPLTTCTEWFDDERVLAGSFSKAQLALVSVKDGSNELLCKQQPVACSAVSRAIGGRFFFLNCSFREYAAPQHITREKLLQMQRDSERANTFWGSVANSIHSYVAYFHLPTLNMRSGGGQLTTRDEFHITIMFDSFLPQVLVDKLVREQRFDEALEIARRHKLSTNSVFQAKVSAKAHLSQAAAVENLGSIEDDDWVFMFCLNRVSSTADEAHSLLKIGLDRCRGASVSCEAVRVLLSESAHRLETYMEAMEGKFDGPDFFDFKRQDLTVSAIVHALHGRTRLVRIIWRRHTHQLRPFRFALLDSFPETTECSEYAELLPNEQETQAAGKEDTLSASPALRRAVADGALHLEGDWLPFLRALLFPKERIRVLDQEFLPDSASSSSEWFVARALTIDDECGQLHLARDLLLRAPEPRSDALLQLLQRIDEASDLLHTLQQPFGRIRDYAGLSPAERSRLFFAAFSKGNMMTALRLTRGKYFAPPSHDFEGLLRQFICHCVRVCSPPLLACLELTFAQSAPAVPEEARPFLDPAQCMQSVLEASSQSNRPEDVALWRRVLAFMPTRLSHAGNGRLLALHDQLDVLEGHLDACQVLGRLGVPTSLAKVQRIEFASVLTSVKRFVHRGSSDWTSLLRDLLLLRTSLFADSISAEEIHGHFVSFLIGAKQPLDRVLQACEECGPELAMRFVSDALDQVFDGCNGLDSPDLVYVASLLKHYPAPQLCDLLAACDLLQKAGVQMIPLQLRVWKNQTNSDVLGRVCAAVVRSAGSRLTSMSDESCRLVCKLLGMADLAAASADLTAAFGEAELKSGHLDRALEIARSQRNSRLAAKCLEAKNISWDETVELAGIVASKGDFATAIGALEKRVPTRAAEAAVAAAEAASAPPFAFDPLLDVPLTQIVQKKKKETEVREEEDDIAGIAKKAWSNFFG